MSCLKFTNKYNLIDSININNTTIFIYFNDSMRWICDVKKDSISSKGDYNLSLYDNYGEIYSMKCVNKQLTTETRKIQIMQDYITLRPSDNTLNQMPDLVINVLKTIDHAVALETLRRVTEQIHGLNK